MSAREEVVEEAAVEVIPGLPVVEGAMAQAAQAEEPPQKLPPLWRNRDYMLLWSGQVVSALGGSMSGIVFPLLILALTTTPENPTGNAGLAGLAGALGTLPYLILSLPAGALIDRWNRKKVMIICDSLRALNIATIPLAFFFNALTVWQLLVNVCIEGSLFVWFNLSETAALPRVVQKKQLPQASAQNEAGFITAFLVGPPTGGFLFQNIGRAFPFLVNTITYAVSVVSLFFIKTNFQGERDAAQERHILRDIREGLGWLWGNKLIRFMAFLTGGANFVGAASGLILIIFAKELGANETEIGWMFSIGSVGGILGAVLGGQIQKRFTFGQVIIAVGWANALIFPLYLFAPSFIVLGIISGLMFMLGPIYNVVQFSYRMALIPDELQGRVNSTFRLVAYGFQPMSQFLAGLLLEFTSTQTTLLFYLVVLLGLAAATTFNSHVRNAKPIEQAQAQ